MVQNKKMHKAQSLEQRVLKTVRHLSSQPSVMRIDLDTPIFDLAGQNWHRTINVTFEIESAFGFEFTDREARRVESGTVEILVKIIAQKI